MHIQRAQRLTIEALKSNFDLLDRMKNGEKVDLSEFIYVCAMGKPGIGKSEMLAKAITDTLGKECLLINLVDTDPADVGGIPVIEDQFDPALKRMIKSMYRTRPHWWPWEGEGVVFVDELGQAPMMNKCVLAQALHERRIGEHLLGPGWTMVCASNNMSDRAGTTANPTHLNDRLYFLQIEANVDYSVKYMIEKDYDPTLVGYIRWKPEALCDLDPKRLSNPSPRSWAKANKILGWALPDNMLVDALTGVVGEKDAVQYTAFRNLFKSLPDPDLPLSDPQNAPIPEQPDILCALVSSLAYKVTNASSDNFLKYMQRVGQAELTMWSVRDAIVRDPKLIRAQSRFDGYIKETGAELFVD